MELTESDKKYALQHGLTLGDMRDFKFDQIKEEERERTWYDAIKILKIQCKLFIQHGNLWMWK